MRLQSTLFCVAGLLVASTAQAATVDYVLDLSVANAFTLTAQASLGDNAGITSYGVPLTGSVLTLDHRTPNNFNLNNFNPAGFTNLRSADNNQTISGSQGLAPNPNQLTGFGQQASTWAAKGVTPGGSSDATSDPAWLAPLVIAIGTYDMLQGTLGFNNASADLLARVYTDSSATDRTPAVVTTQIIPFGLPNLPPVVDEEPDQGGVTAGDIVTTTFTATDATQLPVTFSNAVLSSFVPSHGGTNGPFNGSVAGNGDFTWNTTGFARGVYEIDVTATDQGGLSGSGGNFLVTIENVPEPASLILIVAAGMLLPRRRRR